MVVLKLKSSDFKDGEMIPTRFTSDGENISPKLKWSEVPPGTESFSLIVEDPEGILGPWRHWVVCNIPKHYREIPENAVPQECETLRNSFGKKKYVGPSSPRKEHKYFFKLFALNTPKLEHLNEVTCCYEIKKHVIDKAELMVKYRR